MDQVVWSGFVIDLGLVVKTIWNSHGERRTREKSLQVMKSERELRELKRIGKMKNVDEVIEETIVCDKDVQ